MNAHRLLLAFVALPIACGGEATIESGRRPDVGTADAGSAAVKTDAGAVVCGSATCAPSEICFYQEVDCLVLYSSDGGRCPSGTERTRDGTGCTLQHKPPTCVAPTRELGSLDCGSLDGGLDCHLVNLPIPDGCSRMCHSFCI